jgi:beta-glucosidase
MDRKVTFPKDFYWGVSTASHQVEGGTENQWSVWELANATELAKTAEAKYGHLPNWEEVKKRAQNPSNYISGKGIDHYHRYEHDFDIAKKMNINAFRFGIEWSRIEPEPGQWDDAAIEHYRDYINQLHERNIEPFLNIWHWTVPIWFEDLGGFTKRRNLKYFYRFVQRIIEEYGKDIHYVITLNEPNVYTSFSFMNKEWPPQEHNIPKAVAVYFNLVKAHKKSYKIIKRLSPHIQIGIASQLANVQAKRPHNVIDGIVTKIMRYAWNWWFLRRVRRQQDFIGINYYFTDYYRYFKRDDPKVPLSDVGWYMEPEGLYPLLIRTWAHHKKPIFVTENGVADEHDQYRQWWLQETIIAMERAISEGVDIAGYFHWSLFDNFEWAFGWWPKFGLVAVDRKNDMKREVRDSGHWYAAFIKSQQSD